MVGRKNLSSSILFSCVFFLFPFCFLPTPIRCILGGIINTSVTGSLSDKRTPVSAEVRHRNG